MKHRSVINKEEIRRIIHKSEVCYVGMVDEGSMPYVLPFNFGFENDTVYLHSAKEGKKISILRKNPHVCITFSTDHMLRYQSENVACSWSMKYRSVLVYGKVVFIDDPEEKMAALNVIMRKYAGRDFTFSAPSIKEVQPYKIAVEKFEGRIYGY
ncbi:MAG: pyridoxamine 5'-phosphate oxidase family protein [Bacteroidetes bacterium]|nr:pyridoxamine 5'-phosphate oxidase family protein [Bacteroidota bacterium]